ncbi:MAG: hypothetical protein IPK00_10360 [Deltaproteobacteria bacterium]|nr:hypothetical protein [Deltaproteobacteria bacterium]
MLSLAYRPPFAWDVLLAFFAAAARYPGFEAVVDLDPIGGRCGRRRGRGSPSVTIPESAAAGRGRIASPAGLLELRERLRRLFDLDADPRASIPVSSRGCRCCGPTCTQAAGAAGAGRC